MTDDDAIDIQEILAAIAVIPELREEIGHLKATVKEVTKSRDKWRETAEASDAKLRDLDRAIRSLTK